MGGIVLYWALAGLDERRILDEEVAGV